MTCANKDTKDWLIESVSGLGQLWEGCELTVVNSKDVPKRPKVTAWIPAKTDVEAVKSRLSLQNPGLRTTDWLLMSQKIGEKGQTLAFSIDEGSYAVREKLHFKVFWGLGRVTFQPLKADQKTKKHEPAKDKPEDEGGAH